MATATRQTIFNSSFNNCCMLSTEIHIFYKRIITNMLNFSYKCNFFEKKFDYLSFYLTNVI